MKLARRDIEVFSLSFLDCICCGFGAILLLLVISEYGQPIVLEKSRKELDGQVLAMQRQLNEIRGETDVLDRELKGREEDLTRARLKLARLEGDLNNIKGQFSTSRTEVQVTNILERELVSAYETLTAEMARLVKLMPKRPRTEAVGGIPIDSEYVVFVIDTSGSMLEYHWDTAQAVMREILDIYPKVRGVQVMSDQGQLMFPETGGRWMDDSEAQRRRILERMQNWGAFSRSSPVEGIEEAIRRYWAPDKRISLYVLGDEFTGDSIQQALDQVKQYNKVDEHGRRRVRIHAIGFPPGEGYPPFTSVRFSALMRAMCEENDGTFVGITNEKGCAFRIQMNGVSHCIR
jgi:hypothetical protein